MENSTHEVNFDGLVGPTHNYAGLSFGNIASEVNLGGTSRPKAAALQGLTKMQFVASLGLTQGVLPPLKRPYLNLPRSLGFSGSDGEVLRDVAKQMPQLLAQIYSASNMWVANAATVSPSADTRDGRVHFTPANLVTHLHRSIEPFDTGEHLRKIFRNAEHFMHHAPLPAQTAFGDEGAANMMRFCDKHGASGLEVLVYGGKTKKYPSRQTKRACESIFRLNEVKNMLSIEQNPEAIDGGVFHNDVIAVANESVLLYHEMAFTEGEAAIDAMDEALGHAITRVRIDIVDVSVEDAVKSYLFNSQLLTLPDGSMAIIAPTESQENPRVNIALDKIIKAATNPIAAVHYLNLRESMKNGGGPACLRLRVALTEAELAATHQGVIITDALVDKLGNWVETHYRDELHPQDLSDPTLMQESFAAHDALMKILELE